MTLFLMTSVSYVITVVKLRIVITTVGSNYKIIKSSYRTLQWQSDITLNDNCLM